MNREEYLAYHKKWYLAYHKKWTVANLFMGVFLLGINVWAARLTHPANILNYLFGVFYAIIQFWSWHTRKQYIKDMGMVNKMNKIIFLLMVLNLSCGLRMATEEEKVQQKELEIKNHEKWVAQVMKNGIIYFKDSRTNLCFATRTFWNHDPQLTYVPCDSIPKDLLY